MQYSVSHVVYYRALCFDLSQNSLRTISE